MKNIVIAILLLTACFGLELQVTNQLNLVKDFSLACSGAQGQVTYQASNLPQGVRLYNDKIQLFDTKQVSSGYYPVTIRAQDATGASDERIVVLIIGDQTVSFNTGSMFGNQNSVRTVSISSTTSSSNIRTSTSGLTAAGSAAAAAAAAPVQLPQPDSGVGALLDSLQVPTSYAPGGAPSSAGGAAPSTGSYPSVNFPTGGSGNDAPNFTPTLIGDNQAARTDANRNQITVDDVKSKAIFERQLNAAKALANLLLIVKQATANKNAAQEQTIKRQELYNQAISRQRDAQAAITKAEGDVARIKQAITQLLDNINKINKSLADLDALAKDKNAQRDAAKQGVTTAQTQLNDVTFQITGNKNDLTAAYDAQNAKQGECNNIDNELNNAKNDRDAKIGQAADVAYKVSAAKVQNDADNQRVKDLLNQLADAQAKAAASLKALNDLAAQQNAIQNAINDVNNRIKDLQARKQKCAADLNDIANRITALKAKADSLAQKKISIEGEIKTLSDKIAALTADIDTYPAQIAALNSQLALANKNLNYLRNQLPIYSRILNDAYVAGNSANDAVKVAKQNLDAATKRYNDEVKIEQTATYNIELARTEKDQADQGVEALLRDGAGILPYAAAPSGNGYTVDNTNGAYNIKSWTDFVLASYGVGVKPLFVGDLKTLYPFKLPASAPAADTGAAAGTTGATTGAAGATTTGGDCGAKNLKALSGFIVGVYPNSFKILSDNGGSFEVTFSDCAVGLASKPHYSPAVGDVVAIKGVAKNANSLRATQVACVAQ